MAMVFFAPKKTQGQQYNYVILQAYSDVFHAYDFNRPATPYRQPFLFNHNRHNEVNLNLASAGFKLINSKYRANIMFQAGTYVQDNLAAEQSSLRSIQEASIGLPLHKSRKWWFYAGIFPSHLGFENANSIENMTLTRSLVAENSPYFLSGAALTY
ncbi:MAG: outer membrane beta-barrel protein, partial [Bacteroidetes bacterium]|nr:outer membrane beta-barrel protein [Bacteroidota bacterium]